MFTQACPITELTLSRYRNKVIRISQNYNYPLIIS